MKRLLPLFALIGFLAYTGVYIIVYLMRAFRVPGRPDPGEVVRIWQGDTFMRALLVAMMFQIGLVVLLGFVELTRVRRPGSRGVRVRSDLWAWVQDRCAESGEAPEDVVDRAVAAYRDRLGPPRR